MDAKLLHRSPFQLRPVRKQTVEYLQLRASIKQHGILQPVLVRITERGHEIIDGAHRHECALDLNLDVPTHVVEMTDEQVLQVQVVANEQRIKTLDADLVKRLWKITRDMDHRIVASQMGKSLSWVKNVCQMERLTPTSLQLFDRGKLTFRQAVLLARIPRSYQEQCWGLDESQLQHVVRSLKVDGVMPSPQRVTPMYRPLRQVIDEFERPSDAGLIILNETDGSPVEIWKAALRWVCQMDAATLARREKKFENLDDNSNLGDDTGIVSKHTTDISDEN